MSLIEKLTKTVSRPRYGQRQAVSGLMPVGSQARHMSAMFGDMHRRGPNGQLPQLGVI